MVGLATVVRLFRIAHFLLIQSLAYASEQLKPWTNLLQNLANYGSHLIPRAYSSSGKTLGDAVLIDVLLRQLVAMIDAIEILLCRSAVHAATLQLRAMFEASVYIDWMLAGDRENKAAYYYVHNLLRLRRWAMRVQSGTAESSGFEDIMNKAGLPVDETLGNEGKNQAQEIDRVLPSKVRRNSRRISRLEKAEMVGTSRLELLTSTVSI
jgi:hypothetical protein